LEQAEAQRRHRKAPLLLLIRRLFAALVGFISTVTIARLVGPDAYGLANMSTVIFGLAQMFRDFGLTSALMRKGEISHEEQTFLFWFNVATTTILTLILVISAPWVAIFYREPVVASVMLVSVIGFWLGGLSSQHRSMLIREMRFAEVAWIDISGILINFVVALTMGFIRADVWAIVLGNIAGVTTTSLLSLYRSGFVPGRPRKFEGVSGLLKFGANTSIYALSAFVSGNIGSIMIGRVLGAQPLGQYNRASALFALPDTNLVQPITQATLPLLTHLRVNPAAYRDAYLRLVRTLSTFLLPSAVVLSFMGRPLAVTLLGDRWEPAGTALSFLAPTLAVLGLTNGINDLLVTQDRSATLRTMGLFEMIFRVGAVALGVRFGLAGVSLAFTLSTMAVCASRVIVAGRSGPVSAADQASQLLPALPIAAACALSLGGLQMLLSRHAQPAPMQVLAIAVVAGAASAMTLLVAPRSRHAVIELLQTFGLPRGLRAKLAARLSSR